MLNLIAYRLIDYLLRNPPIQKEGRTDPDLGVGAAKRRAAAAPVLARPESAHPCAASFVMLAAVAFIYWLLFRTTLGFEFRASGANPDAARYAGMRSGLIIVVVMAVAGGAGRPRRRQPGARRARPGLAGLLRRHRLRRIAVALLGRSHPDRRARSPGSCSAPSRPAAGRCRSTAGVEPRPHRASSRR